MDKSGNTTFTPPTLHPALLPSVHLSLTIVYTTLYGFLFAVVYIQLWMILYYKHRRFSYQTIFLFLCLLWSGLRTTLFSFYFKNAEEANVLPIFLYWLLYCFPVCLQFMTLCLLVIFFAQVSFRQILDFEHNHFKTLLWGCTAFAVIVFLGTNITCAVIIDTQTMASKDPPIVLVYTRVIVNDLLFIIYAILLSVNIYKVSKLPTNYQVLESQGTTKAQAIAVCVFIIPLYVSRAVYNLIAISFPTGVTFGYSWTNVSDQADINSAEGSFLAFGIILFLWEFLPTFVVVMFFRVKRPRNEMNVLSGIAGGEFSSHAYFFDNPRRYDSDDDLSRSVPSQSGISDEASPIHTNAGHRVFLASQEPYPQGTPPILYANTGPLSTQPSINQTQLYGDT